MKGVALLALLSVLTVALVIGGVAYAQQSGNNTASNATSEANATGLKTAYVVHLAIAESWVSRLRSMGVNTSSVETLIAEAKAYANESNYLAAVRTLNEAIRTAARLLASTVNASNVTVPPLRVEVELRHRVNESAVAERIAKVLESLNRTLPNATLVELEVKLSKMEMALEIVANATVGNLSRVVESVLVDLRRIAGVVRELRLEVERRGFEVEASGNLTLGDVIRILEKSNASAAVEILRALNLSGVIRKFEMEAGRHGIEIEIRTGTGKVEVEIEREGNRTRIEVETEKEEHSDGRGRGEKREEEEREEHGRGEGNRENSSRDEQGRGGGVGEHEGEKRGGEEHEEERRREHVSGGVERSDKEEKKEDDGLEEEGEEE